MEIMQPAKNHKQHSWLKWVGLQEPPVEADGLVPVVRGLGNADFRTNRLLDALSGAGIEAHQRSYQFDETSVSPLGFTHGSVQMRVAVLVREADLARAIEIAVDLDRNLGGEREERAQNSRLSDPELTRLALESGPAPDVG